jgi:hypothetical protein
MKKGAGDYTLARDMAGLGAAQDVAAMDVAAGRMDTARNAAANEQVRLSHPAPPAQQHAV